MRTALTSSSTSRSTLGGTAPAAVKSKRKRPGEFSEPACAADSPSALRKPRWTRWVAVWLREIARRRSRSISACACVADLELAAADLAAVHDRAPAIGDCTSSDLDLGAAGADDALVGELAAALGVERGAVEHDLDRRCPRPPRGPRTPSTRRPTTVASAVGLVVAEELDLAGLLQEPPEDRDVGVAGLLRRGVGLGPVALLLHQAAEALLVDLEALLGRHLQGQVDREAVGVVQLERLVAGERGAGLALGLLHRHVEDRGAGAERAEEGRLLGVDDPWICGASALSSGYCSPITSIATAVSSCM